MVLCLLIPSATASSVPIDVEHSRVTIRAFKSGLFSALAHDHEINAPLHSGRIDSSAPSVELRFDVRSLKVLDPELSAADRVKVQQTMLSDKVLDAERFSEIIFRSQTVKSLGENRFQVEGELTLHGVTRSIMVPVSLASGRYTGTVKLKQTEFGITPVKLFGGAVKLKDVVEISFDIVSK
jgi:polyisoprenoid-binding protein YceI